MTMCMARSSASCWLDSSICFWIKPEYAGPTMVHQCRFRSDYISGRFQYCRDYSFDSLDPTNWWSLLRRQIGKVKWILFVQWVCGIFDCFLYLFKELFFVARGHGPSHVDAISRPKTLCTILQSDWTVKFPRIYGWMHDAYLFGPRQQAQCRY